MKNKKTSSCGNIFSISNQKYRRNNRFADRVHKINHAAVLMLMFLAVFIFLPNRIGAVLLSKSEKSLKSIDIKTEKYFDFFTTEISSTTTNIFEDELISTTMAYAASSLSLLPNNIQKQDKSDLVDNNILVTEERTTENNTIENLEQSIRNSVKTEIETEQRSEHLQIMEILKELTDPEIRMTLSADIISLENFNQNNIPLSTEHNMLFKNDDILKTDRNIELLTFPMTEKISDPESFNVVNETTRNKANKANFQKLAEINKPLKSNSNTENDTKIIFDEFSDNNSSNGILSVTFHERIYGISVDPKEENILNVKEYKSSIDQLLLTKGNENNNTEGENFNHIVIKKVLTAQENSDAMSETTSPSYSETEPISYDDMSHSYSNMGQGISANLNNLNINHSVTIESLDNKVNRNELEVKNQTHAGNLNYIASSDENVQNELDSSEILRKEYQMPEKNYDQISIARSLPNSDVEYNKKENYLHPRKQTVLAFSNKDKNYKNYISLKNETDVNYYLRNINTKSIFKSYSKQDESLEDPNNIVNNINIQNETAKKIKTINTEFLSFMTLKSNINNTEQNINTTLLQKEMLNTTKGSSSANANVFPKNFDDAVATLFVGYPPQDAGRTVNDNLADEIAGIRRALPISIADKFNRSALIIILSSVTACLFVIASITIFLISYQRQNGTLNIEMQERSCGKDNLDEEDAQTFAKLLEVKLSQSDETEECL